MSKRDLIQELKNSLEIFREIFRSNIKLVKSIDLIYEEELIDTIEALPMPESAISNALKTIYIIKSIIGSIHFDELKDKLKLAKFDLVLDMDVYKWALSYTKTKIKDKETKGFIISIIKKCEPIINCTSEVLKHPLQYIDFLSKFRNNDYDDIL